MNAIPAVVVNTVSSHCHIAPEDFPLYFLFTVIAVVASFVIFKKMCDSFRQC